jgi:cytochrome c oxidase assembly protein subunit 15
LKLRNNIRFARFSSFACFAWSVLAWNILVILWGALVRITGSGAGCGNHWPDCNGQFTPNATTATLIEYTHRAMTGLDSILVAALLIWAFRAFPRGHPVRLGAVLSGVFLVTEALIGAALVKLEYVARNASTGRGYSHSAHLINTFTLLACLALTAWWSTGWWGTEKPAIHARGKAARMAAISLAVVMVLGVSGAIAALGDTLYPARSLAAGLAQDFDPAASIFLRLRLLHPAIAACAAAWLLFYGVSSARRRPGVRRAAWIMLGFLGAQVLAGATNLLLLAPGWLQMVHLLLADLLWISLVLLCAETLAVHQTAPPEP